MDYLDELAQAAERDRSWVVNALARHHAKQRREGKERLYPLDLSATVIGLEKLEHENAH